MTCDLCQSPDVIAVAPGTEPETTDLFTLTRGEPTQCWCAACWPACPIAKETA